jgi:hypothetical protein
MCLNSRFQAYSSLIAVDRASSSASVVELVTERRIVAFQSIHMPDGINRYPCELRRVGKSSANAASETP